MTDIRSAIIVTFTPVRDGAELHGKVIGNIYGNFAPFPCTVDYGQMHDKWVPLVTHPELPFDAEEMWVEWSHCVESSEDKESYKVLVTVYTDGREPTAKIVG